MVEEFLLRNGFRGLVSNQDAGRQEAAGSGNPGSILSITKFFLGALSRFPAMFYFLIVTCYFNMSLTICWIEFEH